MLANGTYTTVILTIRALSSPFDVSFVKITGKGAERLRAPALGRGLGDALAGLGVQGDRFTDQLLQCRGVELLAFVDVDGSSRVAIKA
jgi:hypothetical protein